MVRRYAYWLSFTILLVISCSSDSEKFVIHDKWMLDYSLNRAKLKSSPGSVIETNYVNLNDTVFSDTLTGKFNDRWTYEFDKEGNVVEVSVFFDSSYRHQFFYKLNEDGLHSEFNSYSSGDTNTRLIQSKKIGPGKYKTDVYDSTSFKYSEVWTFANRGQEVTKDRYLGDTIAFTVKQLYEDDLLKRAIKSNSYGITENVYYYSVNGYLDSIVVFENKTPTDKNVYVNNEFGDLLYYEKTVSGKVSQKIWMKYEYDDKGNWIKMIQRDEDAWDDFGVREPLQKHARYRLIIRQIKY